MSTITVTNIKATGETASRSATGVATSFGVLNQATMGLTGTLNISSATDVSTGAASLSFTNNMSSVHFTYCGCAEGSANTSVLTYEGTSTITAASVDYNTTLMSTGSSNITLTDADAKTLVHGDLA